MAAPSGPERLSRLAPRVVKGVLETLGWCCSLTSGSGVEERFSWLAHLCLGLAFSKGKTWIGEHPGWTVEIVQHAPAERGEWHCTGDETGRLKERYVRFALERTSVPRASRESCPYGGAWNGVSPWPRASGVGPRTTSACRGPSSACISLPVSSCSCPSLGHRSHRYGTEFLLVSITGNVHRRRLKYRVRRRSGTFMFGTRRPDSFRAAAAFGLLHHHIHDPESERHVCSH